MTKEETISKLYGLRAGLSLVVDNGQKARETKEKSKQLQSSLDKKRAQLAQKYDELQEQQKKIYQTSESNFKYTLEGKELKEKLKLAKLCSIPFCGHAVFSKLRKKWPAMMWVNLIVSILLGFGGGLLLSSILFTGHTGQRVGMGVYFGICGSVAIFFSVSPIISSILPINLLCYLRYKKRYEKAEEKYNNDIKNFYMPKEKEKFRQMREEYEKESQQFAVYKNEMTAKIEQADKESNEIINNNKLLVREVNSTYEPFLVKEDWKNIDLLIFYLQTGRADTLKEALILADRQRQTNAIVNEISKAAATISNAINCGFAYIGEGLKYINTNLATLVDEMSLQNALARHSNKKIEDLIKEVDKLEMPSIVDVRVRN